MRNDSDDGSLRKDGRMKLIQRGDLKPGTIVEHRTRFLVSSRLYGPQSRKHAGRCKFIPLGDVEQVVVGERWRVYRVDLRSLGIEPYWIAQGGELGEDGRPGWYLFDTFTEAISYADKCARVIA